MKTEKGKAGKTALTIIISILMILGWVFFILRGPACASWQKQAAGAGEEKLAEQSAEQSNEGK